MAIQWLTTAPNPRTPATGFDAGQRGWKLHAVIADDKAKFGEIAGERALCGLLPSHGWGLDLFIEDKCSRCVKAQSMGDCGGCGRYRELKDHYGDGTWMLCASCSSATARNDIRLTQRPEAK